MRIISSGFGVSLVASGRQWRCQGTRTRIMILASRWVYFLEKHRYEMKASEKDDSFGTITTQAEEFRRPALKVPRRHLWLMSNRPFWSSSSRWSGMVINDLRCLCIGIWIAPGVFWLPYFLPTDVGPVTTQPLEAALEHEATKYFSKESSSAGEKQLPSHCGLERHWTANHVQVQVVTCSWQESN